MSYLKHWKTPHTFVQFIIPRNGGLRDSNVFSLFVSPQGRGESGYPRPGLGTPLHPAGQGVLPSLNTGQVKGTPLSPAPSQDRATPCSSPHRPGHGNPTLPLHPLSPHRAKTVVPHRRYASCVLAGELSCFKAL